jgi:hypothetical protein
MQPNGLRAVHAEGPTDSTCSKLDDFLTDDAGARVPKLWQRFAELLRTERATGS